LSFARLICPPALASDSQLSQVYLTRGVGVNFAVA